MSKNYDRKDCGPRRSPKEWERGCNPKTAKKIATRRRRKEGKRIVRG